MLGVGSHVETCALERLTLRDLWHTFQSWIQELTDGMAGARRASAKTKLYVRPRVVLPKTDTMAKAMRLPRPDLMNPPDSQKAIAISHLQAVKGSYHLKQMRFP